MLNDNSFDDDVSDHDENLLPLEMAEVEDNLDDTKITQ